MKDVLQIAPKEVKDTLIDMAYSLIESGLIKKSKKYKGPNAGGETEGEQEGEKKEGEEKEGEEKTKENGDAVTEEKKEEGDDVKKVNIKGQVYAVKYIFVSPAKHSGT